MWKQKMKCRLSIRNHIKSDGRQPLQIDVQFGREYRKIIKLDISIEKKFWDATNRTIKHSHPNYKILVKAIRDIKAKIDEGVDRFHTQQISRQQLINFLSGKSDFSDVDTYIESEIKRSRTPQTYKDYKFAFGSFKLHTGNKGRILKFEDINTKLLKDFKGNYQRAGNSNNSFNSIVNKIRAIYNDAYDNGIIYDPLKFPRNYKLPQQRTKFTRCTFEEFEIAIKRVKNLRDWEALALWLLMFCTRGMYFADFTTMKMADIKDHKNFEAWFGKDRKYIEHRRHKTKARANEPMFIRIDDYPTFALFKLIKYSFAYRYYRKNPAAVADINDEISIYGYKIEDSINLHQSIINGYQKTIRNLLPKQPHKNARKTFNTIARELSVPAHIREILIGHQDDSRLNNFSYNDNQTIEMARQVEEAHTSVLKSFKAGELMRLLEAKLTTLKAPVWIWLDVAVIRIFTADLNSSTNSAKPYSLELFDTLGFERMNNEIFEKLEFFGSYFINKNALDERFPMMEKSEEIEKLKDQNLKELLYLVFAKNKGK